MSSANLKWKFPLNFNIGNKVKSHYRQWWSRWISVATHLFHCLNGYIFSWQFFYNLRVPKSRGLFEVLNDFFGNLRGQELPSHALFLVEICIPLIVLSTDLLCTLNKYCMQNLYPQEVDVPTNHLNIHKPFVVWSFGIRVLDL